MEEAKRAACPSAAAGKTAERSYGAGARDTVRSRGRDQGKTGERELLVVSFGTSYGNTRELTIGAIEQEMERSFPDYLVRRSFTSQVIIDRLKNRDQIRVDNVKEALGRAVGDGVKTMVIQPTLLMDGLEYGDLSSQAWDYAAAFDQFAVGKPLLTSDQDVGAVARAIVQATAEYDDGQTAICFMGHGTEAKANGVYRQLQQALREEGRAHYYIGTVEASPDLENVLAAVKKGNYKKAVLRPLMIVAGDHASNDMAGDTEGSWKTAFQAAGYQVICVMEGLGQLPAIRQMFAAHAQEAMDSLRQV